jgi:hypothetical protein
VYPNSDLENLPQAKSTFHLSPPNHALTAVVSGILGERLVFVKPFW